MGEAFGEKTQQRSHDVIYTESRSGCLQRARMAEAVVLLRIYSMHICAAVYKTTTDEVYEVYETMTDGVS